MSADDGAPTRPHYSPGPRAYSISDDESNEEDGVPNSDNNDTAVLYNYAVHHGSVGATPHPDPLGVARKKRRRSSSNEQPTLQYNLMPFGIPQILPQQSRLTPPPPPETPIHEEEEEDARYLNPTQLPPRKNLRKLLEDINRHVVDALFIMAGIKDTLAIVSQDQDVVARMVNQWSATSKITRDKVRDMMDELI